MKDETTRRPVRPEDIPQGRPSPGPPDPNHSVENPWCSCISAFLDMDLTDPDCSLDEFCEVFEWGREAGIRRGANWSLGSGEPMEEVDHLDGLAITIEVTTRTGATTTANRAQRALDSGER